MTTTFSQFIGPNENLSVSFLSTPDFKNNAETEIKQEPEIMVENFIHDDNKCQKLQEKKEELEVKPWSEEYQVKDSKLSFTIDEIKHDQKRHSNHRTFWQTKSERANTENDYTPQSLLEKLRNFKQNKTTHEVNSSEEKSFSFTSESNFSLVSLRNPVFKQLEEMKRQRLERLKRSGLGWHDKTLYEDIPSGELYKIPDEDDVVVADDIEDTSESNENENNNHFSSLLNKNKEENSMSYSSLSIINRLLSEPSLIENSEVRTKTIEQMVKLLKESYYDKSKKIDVEIQTESELKSLKEPLVVEDINKLTFDQLSGQIIKHLKVIEAINNSLYSEKSDGDGKFSIKEEKVMIDSEKDEVVESKNLEKNKAFTNESEVDSEIKDNRQEKCNLGESKYLRSSHSNFEMTPSEKQRLLHRFNKEQKEMVNQLFESMISISSQSLENSMIHNPEKKQIIKTEARIFKSQLCCSPTNSFEMEKVSNKNEVKESEINFQPPKDEEIREMTFLKKNYEDIVSLDPSKILNTSSEEKPQKQLNDGEFEKLEELMRDREMKKSILGSNVADSSFNSESILEIIDTETADKFKKFNPDRLKKVEQIINE